MTLYLCKKRASAPFRMVAFFILAAFIASTIGVYLAKDSAGYASALPYMPAPTELIGLTARYNPLSLKGIKLYADNPFKFDFILSEGDSNHSDKELRTEGQRLIKYFLSALTIPEEDFWVNLSPYEKDTVVAHGLGLTDMGKDLLGEDYILKQLLASLTYPDNPLGKQFWKKVHNKAYQLYGTSNVAINTFNKIWIVPERAIVYEQGDRATLGDNHLKVMMEEDYVAQQRNQTRDHRPETIDQFVGEGQAPTKDQSLAEEGTVPILNIVGARRAVPSSNISFQIAKEIILPMIEEEINNGKQFAYLRQIYDALILATWFKQRLRRSVDSLRGHVPKAQAEGRERYVSPEDELTTHLLDKIYIGKNKTKGIEGTDPQIKEKIYNQYLEAYKKGVYNYIRRDFDEILNKHVNRKYFSGGFFASEIAETVEVVSGDKQVPKPVKMTAELGALNIEGKKTSGRTTAKSVFLKTILENIPDESFFGTVTFTSAYSRQSSVIRNLSRADIVRRNQPFFEENFRNIQEAISKERPEEIQKQIWYIRVKREILKQIEGTTQNRENSGYISSELIKMRDFTHLIANTMTVVFKAIDYYNEVFEHDDAGKQLVKERMQLSGLWVATQNLTQTASLEKRGDLTAKLFVLIEEILSEAIGLHKRASQYKQRVPKEFLKELGLTRGEIVNTKRNRQAIVSLKRFRKFVSELRQKQLGYAVLAPLVDLAAEMVAGIGLEVNLKKDNDKESIIAVSPNSFIIMMLNLFINAQQAAHVKEVAVTIESQTEAGQVHQIVRISDSGVGIDKEKILEKAQEIISTDNESEVSVHKIEKDVLERIQRIVAKGKKASDGDIYSLLFEKGFTGRLGGTGMGLYFVKKVMDNVGGKIEIESALGKGTTFTLKFPTTSGTKNFGGAHTGGAVGASDEKSKGNMRLRTKAEQILADRKTSDHPNEAYLREALNREEEQILFTVYYSTADNRLKKEIEACVISSLKKLLIWRARKINLELTHIDDLAAVGELEVLRVMRKKKFDPNGEALFASFIKRSTNGKMRNAFDEQGGPVNRKHTDKIYAIKNARKGLGAKATIEQVAKESKVTAEQVVAVEKMYSSAVPLDASISEETALTRKDLVPSRNLSPFGDVMLWERARQMFRVLARVKPGRRRVVLKLRILGWTQEDIGSLFGLDRQAINYEEIKMIMPQFMKQYRAETKTNAISLSEEEKDMFSYLILTFDRPEIMKTIAKNNFCFDTNIDLFLIETFKENICMESATFLLLVAAIEDKIERDLLSRERVFEAAQEASMKFDFLNGKKDSFSYNGKKQMKEARRERARALNLFLAQRLNIVLPGKLPKTLATIDFQPQLHLQKIESVGAISTEGIAQQAPFHKEIFEFIAQRPELQGKGLKDKIQELRVKVEGDERIAPDQDLPINIDFTIPTEIGDVEVVILDTKGQGYLYKDKKDTKHHGHLGRERRRVYVHEGVTAAQITHEITEFRARAKNYDVQGKYIRQEEDVAAIKTYHEKAEKLADKEKELTAQVAIELELFRNGLFSMMDCAKNSAKGIPRKAIEAVFQPLWQIKQGADLGFGQISEDGKRDNRFIVSGEFFQKRDKKVENILSRYRSEVTYDLQGKALLSDFKLSRAEEVLLLSEAEAIRKKVDSKTTARYGRIKECVVGGHLRWAAQTAGIFADQGKNRHIVKEELIAAANLGLSIAVDKIDWRKGVLFTTYSHIKMQKEMVNFLLHCSLYALKMPEHFRRLSHDTEAAQKKILQRLREGGDYRRPTLEEIAQEINTDPPATLKEKIKHLKEFRSFFPALSFETLVGERKGVVHKERFRPKVSSPVEIHEILLNQQYSSKLLARLTIQERVVLKLHYGKGVSRQVLQEIGTNGSKEECEIPSARIAKEYFYSTREGVRKIKVRAIKKLNNIYRDQNEEENISVSHEIGDPDFGIYLIAEQRLGITSPFFPGFFSALTEKIHANLVSGQVNALLQRKGSIERILDGLNYLETRKEILEKIKDKNERKKFIQAYEDLVLLLLVRTFDLTIPIAQPQKQEVTKRQNRIEELKEDESFINLTFSREEIEGMLNWRQHPQIKKELVATEKIIYYPAARKIPDFGEVMPFAAAGSDLIEQANILVPAQSYAISDQGIAQQAPFHKEIFRLIAQRPEVQSKMYQERIIELRELVAGGKSSWLPQDDLKLKPDIIVSTEEIGEVRIIVLDTEGRGYLYKDKKGVCHQEHTGRRRKIVYVHDGASAQTIAHGIAELIVRRGSYADEGSAAIFEYDKAAQQHLSTSRGQALIERCRPGIKRVQALLKLEQPIYREENVGRGLDSFIEDFQNDITVGISPYLNRAQNVLCIGVGRGKIVYDLLSRYKHLNSVSAISKENYLHSAESLKAVIDEQAAETKGVGQLSLEQAHKFVEKMQRGHITADVSYGLPYKDRSFEVVFLGPAVATYLQNKVFVLEEIKRVLKPNGVAFVDLAGLSLQHNEDLGDFFSSKGGEFEHHELSVKGGPSLLIIRNYDPDNIDLGLKLVKQREFSLRTMPGVVVHNEEYQPVFDQEKLTERKKAYEAQVKEIYVRSSSKASTKAAGIVGAHSKGIPGGIDFNPNKLNIDVQGEGINNFIPNAVEFDINDFGGFTFEIISIERQRNRDLAFCD
ncbi:MAG: methyltransferase domain-containing protein [Candidatus Omnitrophica bacterium]|nr:methyltransferase domain-containing protein [Candidatus Omnitrophota bacterium]